VVLDAAQYVGEHHPTRFILVKAPAVNKKDIESIYRNWRKNAKGALELEIRESNKYELLQQADCAVVKSGTSTLEAMLSEVPFAMVYRISCLSWLLLRPFVRTNTYCLANLIAGQRVVPEFVQKNATGEQIGAYILTLLKAPEKRAEIRGLLSRASKRLGSTDAYSEGSRKIASRFFEKAK
jgi:lipid-A-disaccharide synthase